jgi:hypothetical protein
MPPIPVHTQAMPTIEEFDEDMAAIRARYPTLQTSVKDTRLAEADRLVGVYYDRLERIERVVRNLGKMEDDTANLNALKEIAEILSERGL